MIATRTMVRFRRLLGIPNRWPICTTIGFAFLCVLWCGLYPGFYYMEGFALVLLLWWIAGAMFVGRTLIRFLLIRYGKPGRNRVDDMHGRRVRIVTLMLVATTLLIAFKVPLRLGFLAARPRLERLAEKANASGSWKLPKDQQCGLYTICASGSAANYYHPGEGRVFFVLADDRGTGFIYSHNGIENLRYNAGNAGHLMGKWYWMAED